MPNKYLTKVKKCIIKNCYPINKKLSSEIKLYKKKLSNKCKNVHKNTKKNSVNECASKYYKDPENKEYRNIFTQYQKCNKKFCSKELNELHKNYNFINNK